MTTLLLDTHVLHWWSAEPMRLSTAASEAVESADVLAALALPDSFRGDPADRLMYATAIERGLRLVTNDGRLRGHPRPRPLTVW